METHSHRACATKVRIMDAAERLFALQGVDATSLREITRAAAVNLAAVNYHFGSKEGLIHAALRRRVQPINEERLRLLAAYEASVPQGSPLELEQVLAAFLRPVFDVHRAARDPLFLRLIGRIYSETSPGLRELFLRELSAVLHRYLAALGRALPKASPDDLHWGLFFTVGIMGQCLLAGDSLRVFTHGSCDVNDHESVVVRLIAFAAAGFRAGPLEPRARTGLTDATPTPEPSHARVAQPRQRRS